MSNQPKVTIVRIPGRVRPDEPLRLASWIGGDSPLFAGVAPARSFRLGATGSRGTAEDTVAEAIPEDALVEIEFEGGACFWTVGADLRKRLQEAGGASARGGSGADDGAWDLPSSIAAPVTGTRGLAGKLTIRALRWMGFDPVKAGLDKIVDLAETRSVPREGVFLVGDDGIRGEPLKTPIPDGERTLILLHGTASNTRGSFSKLWLRQPKQWARLRACYGERIFALEHCTLTRSPIENALKLARLLPRSGSLRLLSHSRGGLVGELLALDPARVDRAGITAVLAAAQRENPPAAEALMQQEAQLFALLRELEARPALQIERFVRVACPVIGTSLAGEKLDQWFSLLVLAAIADEMRRSNSRGMITSGLASLASHGLDMLAETAAAIIGSRKRADQLPGLEAQMPGSALVRILNGNPGRGELFVVAGDAAPREQDWLAELRFCLIDRYFEQDHDLVVDTRAMLDGPDRPVRKVFFRAGPSVNHFSYFGNEDSAAAVAAALTDAVDTATLFHDYAGEWPLPAETARGLFAPRALADPPLQGARGIVVLVPGLCGSELQVAGREVWASVPALACGGFRKTLRIDNPAVEPGDPLAGSYLALANALRSSGYVVRMHGYDWRKSVVDSIKGLGDTLSTALGDATAGKLPVHAIVHSMGGVLIRAAFAQDRGLWKRWKEQPRPEARVIMLGTPNQGSHAVTLLLTKRDEFFAKLAMLDLHNSERELLEIAQHFPGVLELLPNAADENGEEIRLPATWQRYCTADGQRWPVPPEAALTQSGELWRTLLAGDPLIDDERLIYVAGTAKETPRLAEIAEDGRFRLLKTADGDGRVTWASGIPAKCREGGRLYYMNAVHGDMPAHTPAFPALQELLEKGETGRSALTRKPVPIQARGAVEAPGEYAPVSPAMLSHYPTRSDLLAAATGATLRAPRTEREEEMRTRVRVIHGDLIFVDAPVLVGHIQGTNNLEQAEYILDRALNGRMQNRLDAGIYAGPLGSYALFPPQPEERFAAGAIVIGIGRVGELSPGSLCDGVARALVAYAITRHEERKRTHDRQAATAGKPLQLPVCALLIGAAIGELSLRDSVTAILRGHRKARERLADAKLDDRIELTQLDFVELLEDRAIQALNAARDAVTLDGELRRHFCIEDTLAKNEGGRQRAYAELGEDAWTRIAISAVRIADGSGTQLLFNVHGDLARTEQLYNGIALGSIERFTRQLIDTESDNEEVGRTLFELLLPNWLKDQAPDRRRAQLIIDSAVAGIPWELLRDRMEDDRSDRGGAPLSVRSGLVRQLSTGRFRQRIQRADGFHALVVGDPDLGRLGDYFPQLAGAREEAAEVAQLLKDGGFDTPPALLGGSAEQIQIALYQRDWRILHLSGHGIYRETLPTIDADHSAKPADEAITATGMLIGENSVLTTAHIEQMRVVPDFVFINCCSLGRIEAERAMLGENRPGNPMLAANLATQLIEMGVRGVIAAGWRVLDDAAKLFASTFYEAFLAGETFGEAVLAARRATFDRFPTTNTWGAYQCYGDPSLLLRRPPSSHERRRHAARYDFVAPREVIAELERLTQQSRYQAMESADDRKRREERIDALARLCERRGWSGHGDIQEAFGQLWAEFGDHDRAIACYRAAQGAGDGSASMKATEQLINMLARRGSGLLAAGGPEAMAKGKVLLGEAEQLITGVLAVAPNAERHCLLGSIWKRKLKLTADNQLDAALKSMAQAYRNAENCALEAGGRLYYPALSVLHADLLRQLLGTLTPDEGKAARQRIAAVRKEIEDPAFQARDFWDRVAPLDLALSEALFDTACEENADRQANDASFSKAQEEYQALLAYSSRRERESVVGTLDALKTFLERLPAQRKGAHFARARELVGRLNTLADALRKLL